MALQASDRAIEQAGKLRRGFFLVRICGSRAAIPADGKARGMQLSLRSFVEPIAVTCMQRRLNE